MCTRLEFPPRISYSLLYVAIHATSVLRVSLNLKARSHRCSLVPQRHYYFCRNRGEGGNPGGASTHVLAKEPRGPRYDSTCGPHSHVLICGCTRLTTYRTRPTYPTALSKQSGVLIGPGQAYHCAFYFVVIHIRGVSGIETGRRWAMIPSSRIFSKRVHGGDFTTADILQTVWWHVNVTRDFRRDLLFP